MMGMRLRMFGFVRVCAHAVIWGAGIGDYDYDYDISNVRVLRGRPRTTTPLLVYCVALVSVWDTTIPAPMIATMIAGIFQVAYHW